MHPVWTFIVILSIVMVFVSYLEGSKILKNITDKRTKAYALISMISVWGVILLVALEKSGFSDWGIK